MIAQRKLQGIKAWSADDRPREKMLEKGLLALSNAELLAILIATGTTDKTAVDLAKELLTHCDNDLGKLARYSPVELSQLVKGVGKAKAVTIAAALELGRRRKEQMLSPHEAITSSDQVADLFRPILQDLSYEEFWILLLSRSNQVLAKYRIGSGGVHQTLVDSRLIMKYAVQHLASGMVLCHNHPSGNATPSQADKTLTRSIIQGAKLFDIRVLDHIIIAGSHYFSFADQNVL